MIPRRMMSTRRKFHSYAMYHLLASLVIASSRLGALCFAVIPGQQHDRLTKQHHCRNNQWRSSSSSILFPIGNPRIENRSQLSSSSSSEIPKSPPRGGETTPEELGMWPRLDELDRRIFKIGIPCIANFAIVPLVGAVDLFWVGQMKNALAIAGQAAANQVFMSAFWLLSYLPSITATLVSKEFAKDDEEGVQDAVCQAFFVGILTAILGTAFLLLKPDFVLRSVLPKGAPALEYARPYLIIRAFAFMPMLMTSIGYSAFRGILDTVTPLRISLFANFFNAVLDPLLIFRFSMGVSGAALATLASEVISAFTYMKFMFSKKLIRWSKLFKIPQWDKLAPLLKGGAALQLRNLALNITFLAVARVTQSIDENGIAAAAHSIAIQVFQVGGIVLLALSTVAQTLVPNEMVRKIDSRTGLHSGGIRSAKTVVNRLMTWGFVLGAALGALQIGLIPFLHKFTPLEEVQIAARIPSYLGSVLQIINGMVFIGEGVMIGTGNFLTLSFSTIVATIACLLALKVFPPMFGLTGVWMGFGVFNAIRLGGVWLHQTRTGPLAPRNMDKLEWA